MLPSGRSHWIVNQPRRKLIPSQQAGEACELSHSLFQNGKVTQSLMCDLVNYDITSSHPILDSPP